MNARVVAAVMVLGVSAVAGDDEGRYQPRSVDAASAPGRYFGTRLASSDPYDYESLTLVLDAKLAGTLTWSRRDKDDERERIVMPLSDAKVESGTLTAKVGGKRPATVPATLKGRFVTQYPPSNAKGPVTDGLLLAGGWFLALGK